VESRATSSDAANGDEKAASSVASGNTAATPAAAAAAMSVAEAALSEFSPQLTAKILDLLCDESVRYPLSDCLISS